MSRQSRGHHAAAASLFAVAMAVAGVGCNEGSDASNQYLRRSAGDAAMNPAGTADGACTFAPATDAGGGDGPVLNTNIARSIEIDQRALADAIAAGGPIPPPATLSAADGNLFVGPDHEVLTGTTWSGSPSYQVPGGGPLPFIDWDDLGRAPFTLQNFQLIDDLVTDSTAFPRNDSCLASGTNVLAKGDLSYVAVMTNQQHACIAAQRRGATGDSNFYALFTAAQPQLVAPNADNGCLAGEQNVEYDISGGPSPARGDIMIFAHFAPSAGSPAMRVFRARTCRAHVPAKDAVNFEDTTLWEEITTGVTAFAVNTTPANPGTLGARPGISTHNGLMDPNIFLEGCVSMADVFTGGQLVCDVQFYGSFITRSSGSGGTTPDMKDMGPIARFNLGGLTVDGTLASTCDAGFTYRVNSIVSPTGTPLDVSTSTCDWTFTREGDSTPMRTATGCSGALADLPPGRYTASVTVGSGVGCSRTASIGSVVVDPRPSATVALNSSCLGFGYAATPSGIVGTASYAWAFSGGSGSPSDATAASGQFTGAADGASYTAAVTVSDTRSYGTCTARASASTAVRNLSATARLQPTCDAGFTYALDMITGATGGALDPTAVSCNWSFTRAGDSSPTRTSTNCSGSFADLPVGSYSARVVVSTGSTCSNTLSVGSVTVDARASVSAALTADCLGFGYAATPSNVTGTPGYAWTFTGGAGSPTNASAASGQFTGATEGATYTADVTLTDVRSYGSCTAHARATTTAANISAVTQVLPTCQAGLSYAVRSISSATGGTGIDVSGASCDWTFTRAGDAAPTATATSCAGSIPDLPPGTYAARVTVRTGPACAQSQPAGTVTVDSRVSVTAATTASCDGFGYSASSSGVSGSASYHWTFGPGPGVASDANASSGSFTGATSGTYTATVTVSDVRAYGTCTASSPATAVPFSPIVVHIAPESTPAMCSSSGDTTLAASVTYRADATGGSGAGYRYQWLSPPECAGVTGNECTVAPVGTSCYSRQVQVRVTDSNGSAVCRSADSEVEHYDLVTSIVATNN